MENVPSRTTYSGEKKSPLDFMIRLGGGSHKEVHHENTMRRELGAVSFVVFVTSCFRFYIMIRRRMTMFTLIVRA